MRKREDCYWKIIASTLNRLGCSLRSTHICLALSRKSKRITAKGRLRKYKLKCRSIFRLRESNSISSAKLAKNMKPQVKVSAARKFLKRL